jgi:hypothetical protein
MLLSSEHMGSGSSRQLPGLTRSLLLLTPMNQLLYFVNDPPR